MWTLLKDGRTSVMAVPGGMLVKTCLYGFSEDSGVGVALCFVPIQYGNEFAKFVEENARKETENESD